MKKIRKFVTRGILCFLLYLFLGVCLSYARQPRVSQEYQDAFQPADFYSDTVSCDRACIIEDNEEALELRLRMIAQARERIVLSTFEFRADESGKDILSALMAAAKRGVEVKILAELMKDAKGEILIHTPYVICNDWMYDSFREICKQNPEVSLLTNSAANNGNPFGAADYRMNRDKLLDTGLTLYEYEGGGSYHGKSIVMGEELSAVGSFNMDMRSVYLDTEMMLVIDSREVTAQLKEYLTAYEEESVKVLPDGTREIPEGVTPQELTGKRKIQVFLVGLFDWLRFLM